MRIAQKYQISKTNLLSHWFLEDVFDAMEYMDIQATLEDEQAKELKDKRN